MSRTKSRIRIPKKSLEGEKMEREEIDNILEGFPIEMLDPLDSATEKALDQWFKKVRKKLEGMKS